MKIRNGFVSNSSSSSFVIYGVSATRGDLEKIMVDNLDFYQETWNEPELTKETLLSDFWDAYESIEDIIPLTTRHLEYDDAFMIGEEWQCIGDNETGLQFKESIEKTVKELGIKKSCCTYDEVIYG